MVEGESFTSKFQGPFFLGQMSGSAEGGTFRDRTKVEDGLQSHYWRETFLNPPPAPSVPDLSEDVSIALNAALAPYRRGLPASRRRKAKHQRTYRDHATSGQLRGAQGIIGRRAANCRPRNGAGMPRLDENCPVTDFISSYMNHLPPQVMEGRFGPAR